MNIDLEKSKGRKGYEICVDGEIRIKFKQSGVLKNKKEALSDDEIKENAIEFVKDDLKETFDELEVELISCNIQKRIV